MTAILTDPHLKQAIADIIAQTGARAIVETGTNDGSSTVEFALLVPRVLTIEIDLALVDAAHHRLTTAYGGTIMAVLGDSGALLPKLLKTYNISDCLFVLDAHWRSDWPLLKELQAINVHRAAGHKCTVLIDDFFVPGKPNFVGCYGGLRSADSDGREEALIPCGYNEPFTAELDRFPVAVMPDYDTPTIGFGIFSDLPLDLGPHFKRLR